MSSTIEINCLPPKMEPDVSLQETFLKKSLDNEDDMEEVASNCSSNSDISTIANDSLEIDMVQMVAAADDSGISTDIDQTDASDDDDIVSSERKRTCRINCHCKKLRKWLLDQARPDKSIEKDPFYVQNREKLWPGKENILNLAQCNYDPFPTIVSESFRFAGGRDRLGRPHGKGRAYFPNGRKFHGNFSHGTREGIGELFDREGSRILAGSYKNDRLQGLCEIATNEGGWMEMIFEQGVAHGPVRRFSPDGHLQWVGRYRFGIPFGNCWRSNDHQGWYYGSTNRAGRMTGDKVIYLYPDLHMALVGQWQNDVMKGARLAKVSGVQFIEGLLAPVVHLVSDCDKEFHMDVSGFSKISSQPLIRDPYEAKFVRVDPSNLANGGEGLFAKRNLSANSVVAFYNGIRFHDCHVRKSLN